MNPQRNPTPAPKNSPSAFSVQRSQAGDDRAIMRLLETGMHVHVHADWSNIYDWIEQPSSLLLRHSAEIKGYLAATLDPAPVAWVRALGVDLFNPQRALKMLFNKLRAPLRSQKADRIACVGVMPWLDHELPQLGFTTQHALGTMVRQKGAITNVPTADVLIRPVDSAEFHAVAAIDQAAFDNPLWWHSAKQLERGAQSALQFDVAFDGHYPVGFIYGLKVSRREAHIVRVSVAPSHHGKGIGAALVAHALRTYGLQGLHKVSLNTQVSNEAAHRLYRRFGFEMGEKQYTVWEKFLRK
ncbi:MAG: GNAT family N-acetyltransferase [Candidatus Promineifilaceae bacterium]